MWKHAVYIYFVQWFNNYVKLSLSKSAVLSERLNKTTGWKINFGFLWQEHSMVQLKLPEKATFSLSTCLTFKVKVTDYSNIFNNPNICQHFSVNLNRLFAIHKITLKACISDWSREKYASYVILKIVVYVFIFMPSITFSLTPITFEVKLSPGITHVCFSFQSLSRALPKMFFFYLENCNLIWFVQSNMLNVKCFRTIPPDFDNVYSYFRATLHHFYIKLSKFNYSLVRV